MKEFVLRSDIPIPGRSYQHVGYPFRKMLVGDSFDFPANERLKIQSAAYHVTKALGMKFTVRRIDKDIARVWRIE